MAEKTVGTDINQVEITSLSHIHGQPQVQELLKVNIEAYFQNKTNNENKYGESDDSVGEYQIDVSRNINSLSRGRGLNLFDDSGDKPVTLIGHDDLWIIIEPVHEEVSEFFGFFENRAAVITCEFENPPFDDFIIFNEFNGCPTGIV